MRRVLSRLAIVVAWGLATGAAAQDAPQITTLHLADGTTVPLNDWSLGYDHVAWDKGTPQYLASPQVRKATELWNEKKTYPVAGCTLELSHAKPRKGRAPEVDKMLLSCPGAKPDKIEPKAPDRELIEPAADKNRIVLARSLDLSGTTLTGTKRSFCLVTYSSLVECGADPGDRVVKVVFGAR